MTVTGSPDLQSGMLVDLAILRKEIERVRAMLDHRLLDEVAGLEQATLENLTIFIRNQMRTTFPNLTSVMVERRVSGDRCVLNCK